jgi:hypothetical protein
MSVVNSARFDRAIALTDLQEIYKKAQKSFATKVLLNNINIIIQIIMLIGVLAIILFF